MPLHAIDYGLARTSNFFATHLLWGSSNFVSGNFTGICSPLNVLHLPPKSRNVYKFWTMAFARRNSVKKVRRERQSEKGIELETTDESLAGGGEVLSDRSASEDRYVANLPSRSDVLQACTVTSGLIAALGILIRQVSHVASMEGLPILDCSTEVSYDFDLWHLELATGSVILVSLCRYLLLKTWPDFAESTEAANQQVLASLQPIDYVVVSFLPGISEELLFRGALLPLFGMDWKSVLVVAILFGVLHIGGGRKYSFAVWATFVGFVYGYATVASSSIIVPMVSHALNNLVGGILWRQTSKSIM